MPKDPSTCVDPHHCVKVERAQCKILKSPGREKNPLTATVGPLQSF